MKKTVLLLFSLITALLLTTPYLTAQQYNFAQDKDGETYVSGSITYECSSPMAMNLLKNYLQTIYDEDQLSFDATTGVIRIINATEESKNIYQPFVGETKDYVFYDLTITHMEDLKTFRCTFSNLELYSTIKGFIHKEFCDTITNILNKYSLGKKRLEDSALTKKEKKLIAGNMANLATSLSMASEALYVIIENVQEIVE
jgi:hypothetical protein